jgi:hypothetical protein
LSEAVARDAHLEGGGVGGEAGIFEHGAQDLAGGINGGSFLALGIVFSSVVVG